MRRVWFVTLFPKIVEEVFSHGVTGRYFSRGDLELRTVNPSDFNPKGFKGVDSPPYGGGPGVVLRADVLAKTLMEGILPHYESLSQLHVVYTSPRGQKWSNFEAKKMKEKCDNKDLVFICGRYEGVDERFIEAYVNEEFSVGDYVLSGGELACSIILDSTLRFFPSVLGNRVSYQADSFENGLLDSPKYTRPREFEGKKVPSILLSGDHQKIKDYEYEKMVSETKLHRPDLL